MLLLLYEAISTMIASIVISISLLAEFLAINFLDNDRADKR